MEYRDYYEILGVPRTASQSEIKKAFRKQARTHHPDVRPGDRAAEQRFKDVNEAHAVLGDPDKRALYDQVGSNWEAYAKAGATAGARPGGSPFEGAAWSSAPGAGGIRYEFRTSGGDAGGFSDFFRAIFGDAGPGTGGPARGGARRSGAAAHASGRRGEANADLDDLLAGMGYAGSASPAATGRSPARSEAAAELSLEEAFRGTTRIVEVDGKRLEVTIPPGVDTGSRIRLSGKGGAGRDLHVVCRVRPHPVFTRRGADLERELPVTLAEALLGAEVAVGTLKGRVLLTIPPGTQSGRSFRLTGQGMPRFRGTGHGDLYVRTRVVLPTSLSIEAADAARQFLDLVDQPNPRDPDRRKT
jgi:curved DNA-binding protein